MRRVNVKTGLKQRINDILGGSELDTGEITNWSIQSAMLSNIQRIVKGIVGEARFGRVMKGLQISYDNGQAVISRGYGFTPDGYTITIDTPLYISITDTSGYVYIYLKYVLTPATQDGNIPHTYGKNTDFNSTNVRSEIVFDELGLVKGSSILSSDIVEVSTETPETRSSDGYLYVGKINVDGGFNSNSVITNTTDVGIISLADSNTGLYQDISNEIILACNDSGAAFNVNHAYFYRLGNNNNLDISFTINNLTDIGGAGLTSITIVLPDSCKCANRYCMSNHGNYFFDVLNDAYNTVPSVLHAIGYFPSGTNQYKTFKVIVPSTTTSIITPFLASNYSSRFNINISYEKSSS